MKSSLSAVASSLVVLCVLLTAAPAAVVLIGGSVKNGDFNADASAVDARTFGDTPDWTNLDPVSAAPQSNQATRTNLDVDGSRNAVLTQDNLRLFGNVTDHVIQAGDVFDVSYAWRDAAGWQAGTDVVRVTLFTTADNTIGGARTVLVDDFSPLSTQVATWESVDHNAFYTAGAAEAGKMLFVEFAGSNGIGGAAQSGQFGRLDNFVLEVTPVPEPGGAALVLTGLVILRRRRR